MANKKDVIKGGLRKPVRKPLPDLSVTNAVTEKVHQQKEVNPEQLQDAPQQSERTKRTSIDFPFDVYVAIKQASFREGITYKEFVLRAVRNQIECAYGRLKTRWRILNRAIDVDLDLTVNLIYSCFVLHNFCEQYKEEVNKDLVKRTILNEQRCHNFHCLKVSSFS